MTADADERTRRHITLVNARSQVDVVDRATAPQREALAIDTKRADQARWAHAAAQRHLDAIGIRGRRHARRDLDIAERVLDRANDILERTRQRTTPHLERYRAALRNVEHANSELRDHDLAHLLDPADHRVATLQRTVAALHTWQRWADGETIPTEQLTGAIQALTTRGHGRDAHIRDLANAMTAWAGGAGISLHLAESRGREVELARPELGL